VPLNIFKKELGLNKNFPIAKISRSKIKYVRTNFNLFLLKETYLNRKNVPLQSKYKFNIKKK